MNTVNLCELMIDGDLGYKPEADAHHIAKNYIKLHNLVKRIDNWNTICENKLLPLDIRLQIVVDLEM